MPMNWAKLQQRRGEILQEATRHGAFNVRVFGSVARGDATRESDVDFLVDVEQGRSLLDLIGLNQDLEDLLECPVQVLTEPEISRHFRDQVLREAVAI